VCKYSTFSVPAVIPEAAAPARALAGINFRGSTACLLWNFSSPRGFPFLSAPRVVPFVHPRSPSGLLLAAETAPEAMNTGGVLYALNPVNGSVVWNASALDSSRRSYGLVGQTPAWDSSTAGALFLAFGQGVVALSPLTGAVVGRWEGAGDNVAAAPVLVLGNAGAAEAVYLHTALGTLWRLDIGTVGANVSFYPTWKCDYTLARFYSPAKANCTTFPLAEDERAAALAAAADEPLAVPPAAGGAPAPARRSDFGSTGGWPQTTSRAAAAALAAAVRARWAAAFPGAPSPLDAARHVPAGAGPGAAADAETALMAARLPAAHAAALARGDDWAGDAGAAGYARLSGVGAPAAPAALGAYTTTFPYASPALASNGGQLVLPQFATADGSPRGLYVVSAVTGAPVWAFFNVSLGLFVNKTPVVTPFGGSRSSPTVDGNGNLFVAADVGCASTQANCAGTIPLLFFFTPTGPTSFRLTHQGSVGSDADKLDAVGSASPVVRQVRRGRGARCARIRVRVPP